MKKLFLLFMVGLMLMGLAEATEYHAGDNITIRSMYSDNGVPTSGATCTIDLYSPTQKIIDGASMYDTGDGWYNYTITGWLTTDNRTNYDGFVYCTKAGISGSTSFNFVLVRNIQDEWNYNLNQTISQGNNLLNDINKSVSSINESIGKSNEYLNTINQTQIQQTGILGAINSTLSGISNTITSQGGIFNSFTLMFRDFFEFSVKNEDHYNLQIASDYNFTSLTQDRLLPSNNFNMQEADLPNGNYFTRVRRYSSVTGIYGVWSETVNFTKI